MGPPLLFTAKPLSFAAKPLLFVSRVMQPPGGEGWIGADL
jgi:hypothetical protein